MNQENWRRLEHKVVSGSHFGCRTKQKAATRLSATADCEQVAAIDLNRLTSTSALLIVEDHLRRRSAHLSCALTFWICAVCSLRRARMAAFSFCCSATAFSSDSTLRCSLKTSFSNMALTASYRAAAVRLSRVDGGRHLMIPRARVIVGMDCLVPGQQGVGNVDVAVLIHHLQD